MGGRASIGAPKTASLVAAAWVYACLLVCSIILYGPASADSPYEPKRVLLLHSFGRDFLPWSEYARAIRAELERRSSRPLNIQEQTLLTARFDNPVPEAPFVDYLRALYQRSPPDAVISIGGPAASFVQKHRAELFPETSVVLTAVEQRLVNRAALTDDDTVIAVHNDFAAFIESILRVLPDTQTIAVVIGASRLEKFWLDEAQRESKPLEGRVGFVWYADLPFRDILERAAALPPHNVLAWGLMSVDAAGVAHEGDLPLRSLYAVANAPIFSFQEAFFGQYTVGGPMHSIGETSGKTVDAVIRILNGEKPANIKVEPIGFASPKYDWRELQRWGISESNLPPGSEVLFREPTFWKKYQWEVALIASVILVQAALISGLLHERHRRRLAEVESRQRLAELARINRYSAAGEMATSLAHELNQPLGSILTNAETAELMLKSVPPDLDEVQEILADIRRDDRRASEVIRRLRSMLKRAPVEVTEISLNETIREAIGIVSALAEGRAVTLKYLPALIAPRVKGDLIQVQQVVLNVIMNAIDAVSEGQTGKREVTVTTGRSDKWAEILIGDSGPGVAGDHLTDVFEPFFTTKAQGMGMGLAIARTIVEAHHGDITVENRSSGGALFRIRLPLVG